MIRKNQEKRGRGANILKICIFLVAVLSLAGGGKERKNRKIFKLRKIVMQIR